MSRAAWRDLACFFTGFSQAPSPERDKFAPSLWASLMRTPMKKEARSKWEKSIISIARIASALCLIWVQALGLRTLFQTEFHIHNQDALAFTSIAGLGLGVFLIYKITLSGMNDEQKKSASRGNAQEYHDIE